MSLRQLKLLLYIINYIILKKERCMAKTTLKIKGMSCQHCVMSITNALKGLKGVGDVKVSLEKGNADVSYDEKLVTIPQMSQAVADAGYTVE
jgi:copper chaperone